VDEDTLNVSARLACRRMTRRTKALVVTHSFGFPAPLDELLALGVPIVEDCSLALGARYRGRPVGSHGALSVFSMYATKIVCAGEGGMVCTDDRRVLERLRDLNGPDRRETWRVRYNYKLTDLAAGLALSQMRRLPSMLARRRAIAARYRRALRGAAAHVQITVPKADPNYYRFIIRTPRAGAVIREARRAGIGCDRPVFRPLHRYLGGPAGEFPGTEAAFASVVSVPIFPALSERQVARVASGMRRIVADRDAAR
jgi:dTDP-4-amino-4,6-dideoxygalactose transaminase